MLKWPYEGSTIWTTRVRRSVRPMDRYWDEWKTWGHNRHHVSGHHESLIRQFLYSSISSGNTIYFFVSWSCIWCDIDHVNFVTNCDEVRNKNFKLKFSTLIRSTHSENDRRPDGWTDRTPTRLQKSLTWEDSKMRPHLPNWTVHFWFCFERVKFYERWLENPYSSMMQHCSLDLFPETALGVGLAFWIFTLDSRIRVKVQAVIKMRKLFQLILEVIFKSTN